MILVNCGGTIDLIDLLKPEPDTIFYVLDSHRPYHVNNAYSEGQIKILGALESDEELPDYDDIYREVGICFTTYVCIIKLKSFESLMDLLKVKSKINQHGNESMIMYIVINKLLYIINYYT